MTAQPVGLDAARVAAARLWAAHRLPYLASAVFATTVRAAPGAGNVTASEQWCIDADPSVVAGLDVPELGRLLAHLVGHLVRDHGARARATGVGATGRAWWLRCADAELNDDLRASDCVPELAPDLPADLGCAEGGLAETYFARRPSDAPGAVGATPSGSAVPADGSSPAPPGRQGDGRRCGSAADGSQPPGRPGADSAGSGLSPAQAELVRLGVATEIRRSEGRKPGSVPGGWSRWAETMLPARVDWRRVLAAEVRSALAAVRGNVDYTYARPSRRAGVSPRIVLSALQRPVPEVAIVCDTSGSMHEELLGRALAEVEALLVRAGLRAGQVRVLAVDTDVHAISRPTRARQVELVGGGGTDMGAGLEAAARLGPRPAVVVVLTDGFTPWPERPPPRLRVVVGLLADRDAPVDVPAPGWARVVRIEDG